jgi:hypothetical protein
MRTLCLALPLLLTGCIISGGSDPKPCDDILVDQAPSIELRDPESGVCTFQGGGGGGGGGGSCDDWGGGGDPTPSPTEPQAPGAFLDWAACYQGCEGLDEQSCLTTSACRAAYIDEGGVSSFYECWGTAPSGPIQGGACENLDAFACSLHDDCSAVHGILEAPGDNGGFTNAIGYFERCVPEPGTPDAGECTGEVTCDALFPNCPADTLPGIRNGCYTGYCIPLDQCESLPACTTLPEDQCVARSDCEGLYQGVDCTCVGEVCSCTSWVFDGCESGA